MPLYHLPISLGLNLALVVVLTGLGLRLIDRSLIQDQALKALVGCCLGLSCFIAFIFAITALGILQAPLVIGFLVIAGLLGYPLLQPLLRMDRLRAGWQEIWGTKSGYFYLCLLGLMALAAVANLLFAYAPPTGEDELHYHITLPALFASWGEWVKSPAVFSSYFPLNGQMLYTGIMLLRGGYAVKAMVWLTGLLMAYALYVCGRRFLRMGKTEALFAAALMYTAPMMTSYSGVTSVAFINLFFEIVAVMVAWEWREKRENKLLLLLAILAGVGMGFRMYAAPWVIAIALCVLWPAGGIRLVLRYGVIAGLLYSPWLIRNIVETGNPLYPWPLWEGAAFDPYQMGMLTKGHDGFFTSFLKLPLSSSVGGLIWGVGPLPWSLAPFVVLHPSFRKDYLRLVVFTIVLVCILHVVPGVRQHPRYYDAALPWLALFAAAGFKTLLENVRPLFKRTLKAAVLLLLVIPNLLLSLYFGGKRIPLMIGKETEDQYLRRHYPGHEGFEMFQYLRDHFPASETVLRLGDPPNTSAYYYPFMKIMPLSSFPPEFYRHTKTKDFADALRAAGIENILFPFFSYECEKDGPCRFTEYRGMNIVLPPLLGPYFEIRHRTPESILFRVKER